LGFWDLFFLIKKLIRKKNTNLHQIMTFIPKKKRIRRKRSLFHMHINICSLLFLIKRKKNPPRIILWLILKTQKKKNCTLFYMDIDRQFVIVDFWKFSLIPLGYGFSNYPSLIFRRYQFVICLKWNGCDFSSEEKII